MQNNIMIPQDDTMFNVHAYLKENYSEMALESYEEATGLNGWDHLLSCSSEEGVDDLLEDHME
jgi:hypothetical protein